MYNRPTFTYHNIRGLEMPREDRRIFFDFEETYKAVYQLCAQKGLPKPPAGSIVRIEPNLEEPLELDFFIENHKTNAIETVQYTRDFVVASLMILCRSIGIPLPKGANKTLELSREQVVLRVQMMR